MDVLAMLRSRRYLLVLVVAGILGVPLSVAAYWFLVFASDLQRWVFMVLPSGFGYDTAPSWWSIPVLGVGGLLVAVTIRCLPGQGGESPADGFKAGHVTAPSAVPGIAIAALLTLGCGAVLGPEAPLIALGGGLALLAIRLTRAKVTPPAAAVLAGAGSFATISTLLGSPLLGAFLLMEASGVGGPALGTVLLPGLLAAGIGSLIFTGLDSWTGHGTFSLSVPDLPQFARPTIAEFGWAFVIGVAAAVVAVTIRWLALRVKPQVERRIFVLTPIAGMAVGVLAVVYAEVSNRSASEVLFSGQTGLGPLRERRELLRRFATAAARVQEPCLQRVIGQLSRRTSLSGPISGRSRRHRDVPSPRAFVDSRGRRRHRGDVGVDAEIAVDVGALGDNPPLLGRFGRDAAGHRRRRGSAPRIGPAYPGTGGSRRCSGTCRHPRCSRCPVR
jgi:hypothetical protein